MTAGLPPQTVADVLDDLRGVDREALREALHREGLAEKVVRQCEDRFGDTLATVLDTRLGPLVGQGLETEWELTAARRRTRGSSGSEDVTLADLEIVTVLHPAVEVRLDAVRLASVTVDVDVSIVLLGVVAVVTGGEISGYRSGDVVVRATARAAEQKLLEREWTGQAGVLFAVGEDRPRRAAGAARPVPPRQRLGWVVSGLLIVVGVAFTLTGGTSGGEPPAPEPVQPPPPPEGVSGTVRPGSGYNVRAGPSTRDPEVGAIGPGTPVRVRCLDGNWAKLVEPYPDDYVYREGLDLDPTPPAC